MTAMTKAQLEGLFMEALRVPAEKASRLIGLRLIGLGYGEACGRCGGTGHFSYNPMDGTTCFKCRGAGQTAPHLTQKLLTQVRAEVEAGKLDAYIAEAQRKNALKALALKAADAVMAAWTGSGIPDAYDWRSDDETHRHISQTYNAPCSALYQGVSGQALTLRFPPPSMTRAQRDELAEKVAREAEEAVAEIERLGAELRAYLASREVAV